MTRGLAMGLLKAAGLVALYVAATRLGVKLEKMQEDARILWPQAGVALGGLLVLGPRYWPAVAAGSLLVTTAGMSGRSDVSFPLGMSLGFAAGNTLGALLGAWGLRRFCQFDNAVGRVRDVYAFLLFGIVIGPLAGASIVVPSFVLFETGARAAAAELFARRVFGHALSNMVLAPVLLAWTRPLKSRWPLARVAEGLLLLELVILVCENGFTHRALVRHLDLAVLFAPFPFVIWAALRFTQRGAVTVTLIIAGIAILGTSKGFGPFAAQAAPYRLLLLQVYLATIALCGMALAAGTAERMATEEKLIMSGERLRALSARLQAAREEERALISREIHDELGQQLTGLKMALHSLAKRLPKNDPVVSEKCAALAALADESVQTVRRIATDLRPAILDDLGLTASMRWLADEFRSQSGLAVAIQCDCEEVEVGQEAATALFRILQESLTNVARHARATRVDVTLELAENSLVLTICDDGVGIVPQALTGTKSLGVAGMRERAELLGGTFSIAAREIAHGPKGRKGTVVCARIPLSASPDRGTAVV